MAVRSLILAGAAVAAVALGVSGCTAISNAFSGQEPPLPGTRVSVLSLEGKVTPDPRIASVQVQLPSPYVNTAWPTAGGHPTHAMHHLSLPDRVAVAWRVDLGTGANRERRMAAAPVVSDGIVFALDAAGTLSAHRATNGVRLWTKDLVPAREDRGAIGGGLAVDAGILYASTPYGEMIAMDAASGKEVWRRSLGVPLRGSPTVSAARVFVISHDNRLHALAIDTGAELWTHEGIQETAALVGGGAPAVAGDTVIVPYSSGELFALRVTDGRELWSDALSRAGLLTPLAQMSDIGGLPVVDRGVVFAVGHAGRMIAEDIRTGARIWEQDYSSLQTPWIAGDFLFLVTVDADVVAISRVDGRVRWVHHLARFENETKRTGPISWTGPVLAGDRLVLASTTGDIVALSPYSGDLLGTQRVSGGVSVPPVVADGTLYIVTDTAALYAMR